MRRYAFGAAAAAFVALGLGSVFLWHLRGWVPIALYGTVLCTLALFERGRYRPALPSAGTRWQPTGERFFDPATGAETKVFYDPRTGARDYRTR